MIFGVNIRIYGNTYTDLKAVHGTMSIDMIKALGNEYMPSEKHDDALHALERNEKFSHTWEAEGIESKFQFWPVI